MVFAIILKITFWNKSLERIFPRWGIAVIVFTVAFVALNENIEVIGYVSISAISNSIGNLSIKRYRV